MSGHYKNITGYSTSDIEKYRKGELSPREMHELEKAALEDPFLADALEGMEIHRSLFEPASFDDDKDDLRTRLADRVAGKDEKKRVFLPRIWMRWAAAVIGLIGMGTIARYSISGHSKMNVAMEPATAANKTPAPPEAATAATADSTHLATPAAASGRNPSAATASAGNLSATTASTTKLSGKAPSAAKPSGTASPQNVDASLVARADDETIKVDDRLAATPQSVKADKKLVPEEQLKRLQATLTQTDTLRSSYSTSAETLPAKSRLGQETPVPIGYLPATAIKVEGKRYFPKYDTVEYNSGLYRARPVATNNLAKDVAANANPNDIGAGNLNFKSSPAPAFAGKVLGEHDQPLAGVAIYLSGHRDINTTTDQSGQFRLPLRPKDSTQKLLLQYVGYEQTAIDLAQIDPDDLNPAGNIIRLQPEHPSLNEVIITGYGAKRKETLSTLNDTRNDLTDSLWTKASPTISKWAYIHYLQTAARKQPVDSSIKGIEIISFIVNKKGGLSSFKIEQSLSPAHDASTIRLIQEGPQWHLLHGHETRASVRVIY